MAYETVLVERRGEIGLLTLNRPERMNAINNTMAVEWGDALAELNDDPAVAAIVMTGAGRAFSSGADVARFEDAIRHSEGQQIEQPRPRRDWIAQVRWSKPIVCAINGPAIGAGLTRVLPCDVRLASTAATFSMRFAKVGIVPEIGSTQILPQIVGLQPTADLMLSARTIDAAEALHLGLVQAVVAPEELLPAALRLATEYAENGTTELNEIKRLLYASYAEPDLMVVVQREAEALQRCYGSPEQREAVQVFREKREPDFRSLRSGRT